jgi:soluble lytic murein transglycosylase-like protein
MNPVMIVGALAVIAFFAMAANALGKDIKLTATIPKNVSRWADLANQYASTYSILDPEEILAVIWTESTGNPNAENPGDPSWGLMGVTANIAHFYGGFAFDDTSWHDDPDKNVKAGAGFLADLKNKYSDRFTSNAWVAGYNEGETNLLRGLKDQAYVDTFNTHLSSLKGAT